MILHDLRKTNSRIEKIALLRTVSNGNSILMFSYAYNPDKMYYQKFKYIDYSTVRTPYNCMFVLLDKISKREIVGNEARTAIENYSIKHGNLIKLICNKDLDCGVTATTLNKVFGKDFIPVFKVQLATEVPIEKIPLPVIGQIKYNGVRVIAIVKPNEVIFKTRNGKKFSFPKLEYILTSIIRNLGVANHESFILDGELTIGDSSNSDHTSISGLVNSAIHGNPIKHHDLQFNVFDFMLLQDFYSKQCDVKYEIRYNKAKRLIDKTNNSLIKMADWLVFTTHKDIQTFYENVIELGYEGLILKPKNHLYSFKRSKDWIKLKEIKSADLSCIGIEEGEGKYHNMIGALCCEGIVEGKHIHVNVGSGLTDVDRSFCDDFYLGKCIEIKYNSIIQDKSDGSWSLFLPRFVTIREDKSNG